jgi:acyl carrier protein
MGEADPRAERIIAYLKERVLRDPRAVIEPETPLVSSGLVDSFSLVDILSELETITGRRIAAGRVGPEDLDTVAKMLATAERVGVPR